MISKKNAKIAIVSKKNEIAARSCFSSLRNILFSFRLALDWLKHTDKNGQ